MGSWQLHFAGGAQLWRSRHVLLLIPVGLVVLITVADVFAPADIVLGPLLVIAPAITAWGEGPWTTGGIGALAVGAQAFIGWRSGMLFSRGVIVQVIALALLSSLVVALCVVRDRRRRELSQVRSVAEAAQRVLLWPLPRRLGALRIASVYLAAEDEASIGGDLYAATRIGSGARFLIGDVRGKGLPAIGEAALLLGAFREAVHHNASLPALAASLERSVTRYLADFEPEEEAGERFVTALLLDVPDDEPIARVTSCGHLPPLLLGPGTAAVLPDLSPTPPLGVGLTDSESAVNVLPFRPGDTLLLYTDGVIEARDHHGLFYPLAERAARWAENQPTVLLDHLLRDLLTHTGGRLGDDAALIAIRRTASTKARADTNSSATSSQFRKRTYSHAGERPGHA
ncbi:PP2C family protein-serine/threonine phosphatase [Streptomyces sp. NPDC096040]|uniref:PP2C family protein-serine/threonine phosphatase n=1 Tax=Streptomyces sp. NPDC096040 TaxID=3155541 RepID=UPI0033203583